MNKLEDLQKFLCTLEKTDGEYIVTREQLRRLLATIRDIRHINKLIKTAIDNSIKYKNEYITFKLDIDYSKRLELGVYRLDEMGSKFCIFNFEIYIKS